MVKTIYVVRHGLRANQDPPPTGIAGDVPISQEGLGQAEELAAHLVSVDPKIRRIYSSPFYRCLQTISPAAKLLNLPIQVETGLGEFYHLERSTHPVPLAARDNKAAFPAINLEYKSAVSVPGDGESREMLWARVRNTVRHIVNDSQNVEAIVIATHAAVKIALADVLSGVVVRAGTASLDRFDLADSSNADAGLWKWTVSQNGDTSYLSGGEQMHWSFDMAHEAGSVADEASRQGANPMVKVLLPLDLSSRGKPFIPASGTVQLVDLHKEQPLVKINDTVFDAQWHDMVGTEVYASETGDYLGKARTRLVLEPLETQRSAKDTKPLLGELVEQYDAAKGSRGTAGAQLVAEAEPEVEAEADPNAMQE